MPLIFSELISTSTINYNNLDPEVICFKFWLVKVVEKQQKETFSYAKLQADIPQKYLHRMAPEQGHENFKKTAIKRNTPGSLCTVLEMWRVWCLIGQKGPRASNITRPGECQCKASAMFPINVGSINSTFVLAQLRPLTWDKKGSEEKEAEEES